MSPAKLKYLSRDRDRHGNVRTYVRVPGRAKVRLRAPEGSSEFFKEYAAALEGEGQKHSPPTICKKPGTIGALIVHYKLSSAFKDLMPSTQAVRRRILDRIAAKVGEQPASKLEAHHIKRWRDAESGPEAGNTIVKALRQVFAIAVEDGLALRNPAAEVKMRKGRAGGFPAWTYDDVARFIKHHPPGTMAYRALCLLLFTGARISDARRMGPQHERDGWLEWTQHKGRNRKPIQAHVPIIGPLRAALEQGQTHQLAFITSEYGYPFQSDKSFGNRFSKWCREAGLEGKSAHGLRKHLGDLLASFGLSEYEIMSILGHTSPKQASVYTRNANRRRLAGEGMAAFEAAINGEQNVPLFAGSVPPKSKSLK
jgi:integrase